MNTHRSGEGKKSVSERRANLWIAARVVERARQRHVKSVTFLPRRWVGRWAQQIIEFARQREMILKADALIGELMNPPSADTLEVIQARVRVARSMPDLESIVLAISIRPKRAA